MTTAMANAQPTRRTGRVAAPRFTWAIGPLTAVAVMLVSLLSGDVYHQRQLMLIAIYTLIVSGLNVSFGYGGELALGQVAMFAMGAYTTAYLANEGHTDLIVALMASVVAAGLLGIVSGAPAMRLSGWSLAMASFFLVLLVPKITALFKEQTGGLLGLPVASTPTIAGAELDHVGLYVVTVGTAIAWLVATRNLIVSRFGGALRVLGESPLLTRSLGVSTFRIRMSAYFIGALPAGAAGCFFAYLNSYVSPDAFNLGLAVAVLAASVVGGSASVWGAPVGAAILVLGPLQTDGFERYSVLLYGLFLLAVGVLFSSGLAGVGRRLTTRWVSPPATTDVIAVDDDMTLSIDGGTLQVCGVSKSFGGVQAIERVDLTARPGQVTAIMGANGAGKTTLLNAISGFISIDEGTMSVDGERVDTMAAHRVSALGVKRTFQTPLIPADSTALDIVEAGRLGVGRVGALAALLRLPSFRRIRTYDRRHAASVLAFARMSALADHEARTLPLGTRRLLEVLRAVAGEPRVLLLDEPAAGLDDNALDDLRAMISRAREAGATIVLVEHNVKFLLGLADHVVVMERGRVIAQGTPQEVRRDPAVVASYFGASGVAAVADDPGDPSNDDSEEVNV